MTNLKLNITAIIFAIFALTSCQKENMQELTQTTESTTAMTANADRDLPAEGINIVFDEIKTQAAADKFNQSAQSRNKGYKVIGCGADYDGCTKGQGNSLDYRIYPDNVDALGAPFNGEDEYFFFEVEANPEAIMTYDIALTGMTTDLDLFVFALTPDYHIADTKGMSINGGAQDETLSLTDLNPGLYIVAVDAYVSGIAGHYNLTFNCSAVSANPPAIGGTENLSSITTTQTTFVKVFGQWIDELEPPHFAVPYLEVARDENSLTVERTLVNGNNETTQTLVFDIVNNEVSITETSTDGITIASSLSLDEILAVTYDENQPAPPVSYTSVEFAVIGTTDGIGAFAKQTDIKWYEYAFNSDAEHHFEEVMRDATSINLRDESRGVSIRLDFTTMKVVYSEDDGNTFDLYDIINAD